MEIPLFHVDAFTSRLFAGNPAAVCLLDHWPEDSLLQSIAAENNLSETAFFAPDAEGRAEYVIRWFTPRVEVELCGHATLATAHVIFRHLQPAAREVSFVSRGGPLRAVRRGEQLAISLPRREAKPRPPWEALSAALGKAPRELYQARDLMAVFEEEEEVRQLRPDLEALSRLDLLGVAVTARGRACDFVSRFFAPREGIPEDPVTGSAHCMLAPYWAAKLKKHRLLARQLSARGGELLCEVQDQEVVLAGQAVTYLSGKIHL